jgi:hypothetical protein
LSFQFFTLSWLHTAFCLYVCTAFALSWKPVTKSHGRICQIESSRNLCV